MKNLKKNRRDNLCSISFAMIQFRVYLSEKPCIIIINFFSSLVSLTTIGEICDKHGAIYNVLFHCDKVKF